MKKLYIGLGGIGCRSIKRFEKEMKASDKVHFFCFDNDANTENGLPPESFCCFDSPESEESSDPKYKGPIDPALYYPLIESLSFEDGFLDTDKIELVFLTTSFGEFGSKNIFDIANSVASSINAKNPGRQLAIHMKALVLTHENFRSFFPKMIYEFHELNTVAFVKECDERVSENQDGTCKIDSTAYSSAKFYLLSVPEIDFEDLFKVISFSDGELEKLDCAEKFRSLAVSVEEPPVSDEEVTHPELKAEEDKQNESDDGYVFISYSSKNQSSADAMRNLLKNHGFRTWMAPYDVPAGHSYAQVINKSIRKCSCFVLLLTEDSQKSPMVVREVERAAHYGKPIVPVQLENVILSDEFEFYISRDHIVAINKIDENSENVRNILKSVRAFVKAASKDESDDDSFNPPAVHKSEATENESADKKKSKGKTFKEWLINFLNLFVVSPLLILPANTLSPGFYEKLPDFLEKICTVFLNEWVFLAYCIIVFTIAYFHLTDFDYCKKEYRYYNIDEEFSGPFQSFVNKLTDFCNTNLVLKQTNKADGFLDKFSSSYNFGRIKIGSLTGSKVDYFSVVYPFISNPFCRFFFIGRHTSKKIAVKYLLKQGFDFLGKGDNTLIFCKDGKLHLRLAYRRFVPGILGLEVTQGDVKSDLAKRVAEEYEDVSFEMIIKELKTIIKSFKQSSKKGKILTVVVFVILLAVVADLAYLGITYSEELERKLTEILLMHLIF